MFSDADEALMQRALAQAEQGRFWTRPNPSVGCVLERDGAVIGEGFTQPAGSDHAEVQALKAAGDASGATAYVTLEPCAHFGRTPPCADALIAAGVARVVVAVEDPHPQVSGRGMDKLRDAGIAVQTGLLAEQARHQLGGFLLRMQRGWGRVRLKLAMSLDGRTAMASGESQWITGEAARADVQLLRAASCAIVTGSGTVLQDNCQLKVRASQLPLAGDALERALMLPPLRVVLDSQRRTSDDAAIFSDDAPSARLTTAAAVSAHDVTLPADSNGTLDLAAVMTWLGEQQCNEILVEAGPTLSGALLDAGLVDEIVLYVAPKLIGASGRALTAMTRELLDDAVELVYRDVTPIGDDLRIIATFKQ